MHTLEMHTEATGGKKCEKKFNNFLAKEDQRSVYFGSYLYLTSLGAAGPLLEHSVTE
jgi:hypothetical protein